MGKKPFLPVFLALFFACGPMVGNSSADDLEKKLRQDLQESQTLVAQAELKLRAGGVPTAEMTRLKSTAENIHASHLLMQERFRQRDEKVTALGTKAIERQNAVATAYRKAIDDYLALIDALPPDGTVSPATLDALATLFDKIIPQKKRPLLGTLPYQNLGYPAREPAISPSIVPAYRGGNRTITPADTAASVEAPISEEITALAQSLQWNPVLIYEWVKNNVETEWYWGVMKGAEETLRQKSGNDADQAALLVALLRASGFPARFVKGTIEFFPDIDKVKNLTGIDDSMRIAAFFQKAGVSFKPVIAGGKIANFQVEHIWVESEIPYSNYRGAVIDDFGKTWLALDTSIKPLGLAWNAPLDIPAFPFDTLRDEYLQSVQSATPLEFIKTKTEEYLNQNIPGKSYQDLLCARSIVPDVLKILPASLQFRQIAITGEYAELPSEFRHQVRFTATSPTDSELFTITLDALRLSNQRVTLSYEPESVEDQQIIDGYGGLDNTPSYLVRLRPVLKLNGERLLVAQDGLPMGSDYTLAVEVITPNGTERVSNSQIVGNLAVIGIVGQKVVKPADVPVEEKNAERLLFEEALNYIDRWNQSEDELAALLKVTVSRPVPAITVVGGVVEVTYLLDMPHGFEWQGVFVDAALRRVEAVTRTGEAAREQSFLRLSSLQGSILENRLFEDDLKVESVSTAKLLQQAAAAGTPIVTLDRTNVDTLLPTLPFDDAAKQDIANAVNQDLTVKIPQSEFAYQDWTGIGYVKEDPQSGESGWMLSGMIAGGMTAQNKSRWINEALANLISLPYSVSPNPDPKAVTSLKRVTDYLAATAGEVYGEPLMVMALDDRQHPVQNVPVTFKAIAGGGTLQGVDRNGHAIGASGAQVTVRTGIDGIARAKLTLGQHTSDSPYYVYEVPIADFPYPVLVGLNLVSVSTPKGSAIISTDKPMEVLGYPGSTVDLIKVAPDRTDNTMGYVNTYSGPVWVKPVDRFGNPVSNKIVTFATREQQSLWEPPLPVDANARLFEKPADCPGIATQTGCDANLYDSIEKSTDSSGVYVSVVLGNTDNTRYPITATVHKDIIDINMERQETDDVVSVTFNHDSYPVMGRDSGDIRTYLSAVGIQHIDENGKRIDAGLAGIAMTTPLETLLFVHEEVDRNRGAFTTRQVTSGKVDYIVYAGGGSASPPSVTVPTNGAFTATFTPGEVAGLNRIAAKATATVQLGSGTTTMTDTAYFWVWGVKPEVAPNQEIYVNKYGYPEADTRLTFTISPANYTAYSKYLVIYEDGAYMGFTPAGDGFALLSQGGAKFDIRKKYTAQLVLNWGSRQEIKSAAVPLNVTMLCLIPDYDHNRKIDYADRQRVLNKDIYYFWVNDDDGNGDTGGKGIPNTRDPATIGVVNGTRDLVDYFPVQIDLSNIMSNFAPGAYTYHLKNADGALSLVLPWLSSGESGKYLTDVATAQILANAPALPITPSGLMFDATQLQAVMSGKDVVLLEGWRATKKPLVLEIFDRYGNKVFTSSLNVSIDGVEQMFRHKNLIQAINPNAAMETGAIGEHHAEGGEKDRLVANDFANKEHFLGFDVGNDEKYLVLLHGANVNGQEARGWHAEMFKRLYWAGSKARFVGVSWYSFEGLDWNYYPNAVHAFETAEIFGPKLKEAVGNSPVTIMAHSLGNMVVSSYLVDHYQKPDHRLNVTAYLMLNAAVALEAYMGDYTGYGEEHLTDPFDRANPMVHSDWFGYQRRLGASEWHQLVDSSDGRKKLTWRNRFAALPDGITYVNLFSSVEDVLATYAGTQPRPSDLLNFEFSRNSWVLQEKWKGLPLGVAGSEYMGWGFNIADDQYNPYIDGPEGLSGRNRIDSDAANSTITDVQLISRPLFLNVAISGLENVLFSDNTIDFNTLRPYYNKLLVYALPALTTPTGGWSGGDVTSDRNFLAIDMDMKKNNTSWPRNQKEWWHSDIKEVALPFVYQVFSEIIIKGALQ